MSCYYRDSHSYAGTKEERIQIKSDLLLYRSQLVEKLIFDAKTGVKRPGSLLLDSSLIIKYKMKRYQYKIIECGDYYYVYCFSNLQIKKNQEIERMRDIKKVDIDLLFKEKENIKKNMSLKEIEYKNILRSKYSMERLIKANEKIFKTFITLTFSENIIDIKEANKKFNYWISNIRKLKNDFAYVAVPEFQKRGAVHYHLLTNLDVRQNHNIIIPQKKFTEEQYLKMSENQRKKCFDIVYWKHGFARVDILKNIQVVTYLNKYMTKDIDNRLFGHRRYLNSRNLVQPSLVYLDMNNFRDRYNLLKVLNMNEVFTNTYFDKFGNKIEFVEFKKVGNL